MRSLATHSPDTLAARRYPATVDTSRELVLLPGWSMDGSCWSVLLPALRRRAHITQVDLPGTGDSEPGDYDPDTLLANIAAVMPERALLMGWSLGGMLALALAGRYPARVSGVVSLAAGASFVQRPGWEAGMPPAQFDAFRDVVRRNTEKGLGRFDVLQSGGDKASLRWCREIRATAPPPLQLLDSLALLESLDLRDDVARLPVPAIHLLGEDDALVSPAAVAGWQALAPNQNARRVPGANHLLPFIAEPAILEAVDSIGGVAEPGAPRPRRDKHEVGRSFGAAASRYDTAAELQRRVADTLLDIAAEDYPQAGAGRVLDLGCGTGYSRAGLAWQFPGMAYLGVDLAEGMVRHAAARAGTHPADWATGDAESLPLANASVDLVHSSLALQWVENLPATARELFRVLAPGGAVALSSLAPGTLGELQTAWAAVDDRQHVNEFVPVADVRRVFEAAGFADIRLRTETVVLAYEQVISLLRDLKAIGAHNVNAGRPAGMTGRGALNAMIAAYEAFRRDDGQLPATYEVVYLQARRPRAGEKR